MTRRAVAVTVLSILLCGSCAAPSAPTRVAPSSPQSSPTVPSPTVPSPTVPDAANPSAGSPSTEPAATTPQCAAAQLTMTFDYGGVGAGSVLGGLAIRDNAARPCVLARSDIAKIGVVPLDAQRAVMDVAVRPLGPGAYDGVGDGALELRTGLTYLSLSMGGIYAGTDPHGHCPVADVVSPRFWRVTFMGAMFLVSNRDRHSPNGGGYRDGAALMTCRDAGFRLREVDVENEAPPDETPQ